MVRQQLVADLAPALVAGLRARGGAYLAIELTDSATPIEHFERHERHEHSFRTDSKLVRPCWARAEVPSFW